RVGYRLEATCGIEPRRQLVCDGLVVDESLLACEPDGVFVEVFGVQGAAFDARDLGATQCRAVREILGTALRPEGELSVVCGQSRDMVKALLGRRQLMKRCPRERTKEMVLGALQERRRGPGERSRLLCGLDGSCVVPREERHLKLADPIEARCDGQSRIVGETMFEAGLVVFLTVNAGQG